MGTRTFRAYRGRVLSGLFAVALGASLAGAYAVLAQDPHDPPKREPEMDLPGPAFSQEPTPAGTPVGQLAAPQAHGRFLIFPVGQDPVPATSDAEDRPNYEQYRASSLNDLVPLLFPTEPKLPPGYTFAGGGYVTAAFADGRTVVTEGSARFDNQRNFPITVGRWTPIGFDRGIPYAIVNPEGSLGMVTLGAVGGRSAVFVHKRPGTEGNYLQQVFVEDGDYVIAVESYLQEFGKLVAIAESLVERSTGGTP